MKEVHVMEGNSKVNSVRMKDIYSRKKLYGLINIECALNRKLYGIGCALYKGFHGYQHDAPFRSPPLNMESARLHSEGVSRYIADELARRHILGTIPPSLQPRLHLNQFRDIPKGHNTGKWRLITNLSFPQGSRVKNGIDSDLSSLTMFNTYKVDLTASN